MCRKFFVIFLSVLLLTCCLMFSASAENILQVYDSSPISTTYRDVFDGIIQNYDRYYYPDLDYVYFRESDYVYKLIVLPFGGLSNSHETPEMLMFIPSTFSFLGDEYVTVYTLSTRSGMSSDYSISSEYMQYPFTLYVNDGFVYSNLPGGIGSDSFKQSDLSFFLRNNLKYLVILLLFFILLYVSFQFIKKRWFIQ